VYRLGEFAELNGLADVAVGTEGVGGAEVVILLSLSARGRDASRSAPLLAVSATAVVGCLIPGAPPVASIWDRELVTESASA
jgi:hypothetical protein